MNQPGNLLFLLILFFFSCSQNGGSEKMEVASSPANEQEINFPITDFTGLEHLFHQENDSIYVINFWATWCKPCVEELPYFEHLTETYTSEKFKVILISLDFPKQIKSKLIPFIKKHQLKSEVWLLDDPDANSWIDKVDPQWSGAIPATIVYNNTSREFREQSFENYEELNDIIKPFLK